MQKLSGTDLRRQRLRMGWSRDQLAHEVGVPVETVKDWEDGARISLPMVVEQILRQHEEPSEADQLNSPAW